MIITRCKLKHDSRVEFSKKFANNDEACERFLLKRSDTLKIISVKMWLYALQEVYRKRLLLFMFFLLTSTLSSIIISNVKKANHSVIELGNDLFHNIMHQMSNHITFSLVCYFLLSDMKKADTIFAILIYSPQSFHTSLLGLVELFGAIIIHSST